MGINARALPSHVRRQLSSQPEARKRRTLPADVTILGAGHTVRVETDRPLDGSQRPVQDRSASKPPKTAWGTAEGRTRVLGLS